VTSIGLGPDGPAAPADPAGESRPSAARRWARRGYRAAACLVVLGVLALGISAGRVWHVARHDARPASDAIVVLGASQFDGRPSPVFAARLAHAAALYGAGVAPVVVTVGGSRPGDRDTEGAAGKRWLVGRGLPAPATVAVGTGTDTLSSMRAVAEVAGEQGWRSVVIVTDPWHSLRARTMARDLGLTAQTSPTRQGPTVRTREAQARYIVREAAGYLYYKLFGSSPQRGPDAF
jgi:uncharacterized SAM-binding protein YcdF (DUF218 family)